MKTTTNYSFKKPEATDTVNISDLTDSFDMIDEKLKEIETTNEELDTTFKQLVINAGTSNAEIVQARGSSTSLKERLDAADAKSNQLASTKADLTSIFTMANMGQDIKEAMTGGSVAVVGSNAIDSQNVKNSAIELRNLSNDFKKSTTNKASINEVKTSNNELTIYFKNETVYISGTTTKDSSIDIYFNPFNIATGDYYCVMTDKFPFVVDGVVKDTNNTDVGGHLYNSNVFDITVTDNVTISHLNFYIPSGSTLSNHSFNITFSKKSEYTGVYVAPYTSKILTTDDVGKFTNINNLKDKKWVVLGDSISYGYYTVSDGVGGRYEWVQDVADYFGMTLTNLAISGSTTYGFMRNIDNIPSDVDVITVMGGTNDYGTNVRNYDVEGYEYTGGTYLASIRELYKKLHDKFPNAEIVFFNCIGGGSNGGGLLYEKNDENQTYKDYADKCLEVCRELSILCFDTFGQCGINLVNRATYISDTVHPNLAGYNKLLKYFIKCLNDAFN